MGNPKDEWEEMENVVGMDPPPADLAEKAADLLRWEQEQND